MVDISVVFTPVREEADDGVEEEQEDEEENEDLLRTHTEGGSGDDYGRGTVIRLGVERDVGGITAGTGGGHGGGRFGLTLLELKYRVVIV